MTLVSFLQSLVVGSISVASLTFIKESLRYRKTGEEISPMTKIILATSIVFLYMIYQIHPELRTPFFQELFI